LCPVERVLATPSVHTVKFATRLDSERDSMESRPYSSRGDRRGQAMPCTDIGRASGRVGRLRRTRHPGQPCRRTPRRSVPTRSAGARVLLVKCSSAAVWDSAGQTGLSAWTYILPHGVAGQLACHSPVTYWSCEKTCVRLLSTPHQKKGVEIRHRLYMTGRIPPLICGTQYLDDCMTDFGGDPFADHHGTENR
jgi:hypothetical protein